MSQANKTVLTGMREVTVGETVFTGTGEAIAVVQALEKALGTGGQIQDQLDDALGKVSGGTELLYRDTLDSPNDHEKSTIADYLALWAEQIASQVGARTVDQADAYLAAASALECLLTTLPKRAEALALSDDQVARLAHAVLGVGADDLDEMFVRYLVVANQPPTHELAQVACSAICPALFEHLCANGYDFSTFDAGDVARETPAMVVVRNAKQYEEHQLKASRILISLAQNGCKVTDRSRYGLDAVSIADSRGLSDVITVVRGQTIEARLESITDADSMNDPDFSVI
ncbi:hypothetical protein [Alcanivorax sp. 1008]|uniref:hypothetical protein n=1 Tax=Alcanivorax sp. 1008 TaxID=2816853 RepID=UPI001D55777E|nr:hypothetical protein [Alcanivorax sp. 1008]MCC1496797.1 hypothetical protein [Alcanivorax sp. 1008]